MLALALAAGPQAGGRTKSPCEGRFVKIFAKKLKDKKFLPRKSGEGSPEEGEK